MTSKSTENLHINNQHKQLVYLSKAKETQLANKGMGVRVLAELAGHSSIAVTQRYIDVNDAQLARAVELLKWLSVQQKVPNKKSAAYTALFPNL